jgi:hypothetical protein
MGREVLDQAKEYDVERQSLLSTTALGQGHLQRMQSVK